MRPHYTALLPSAGKELADRRRDLFRMRFKREMAGVEQANDRTGIVAPERLGARRQEERIVLAPDREERRLMRPEVSLESWIECNVALVVAE